MVVVFLDRLYYWVDTCVGVRVELMDEKQEQMARDAQTANDALGNLGNSIDGLFEAIADSVIRDSLTVRKLFEMCLDTLAEMFPDAEA